MAVVGQGGCGLKPGVENIWGVGERTGIPVGGWVL